MKRQLLDVCADASQQLLLAFESLQAPFSTSESAGSERRIALANEIIVYRLHRARRRTIGFQVNERGLTVRAPRFVAQREIDAAIVASQRWIRTKQIEWHAWCEQRRLTAIRFTDGGTIQYLGTAATLRLGTGSETTSFNGEAGEIRLSLPREAAEADVRQALQAWLRGQAGSIISERLARFADRIDVRFAGWRLSSARTQWGSCSHDGRVRLNWRLVHFALPVIDYVIAHELAHLRELNHGPRFWSAVAQLLPDYEAARNQIRRVEIGAISF